MSVGSYIALLLVVGGPIPVAAAAANCSDPTGEKGPVHRFLVASLVWANVQVMLVMSTLALGILDLWSVLVAEFALVTLGSWLYLRAPRHVCDPRHASHSLTWIAGASAAVVASTAWHVLSYPVREPDSLHYHMPQLVEWLQAGALVPMRHVAGVIGTYSFGWEALALVFVVPLAQDVLVSAANLLAWFMYSAGCYMLARRIGARRSAAALGSLVLLCLPIARDGLASLQVDLAFGAFFVAGLYFALCYAEGRAPADLAAFIAASASMFWVKLTAFPYGCVLVAALGLMSIVFRRSRRRDGATGDSRGTGLAAALGLLASVPALYFYGRNWLALGNPLGYVDLPPFFDGDPMFTAFWRQTTLLALFDIHSSAHREVLKYVLTTRLGFPGLVSGAFGIVALLQVWKRPRLILPISILPVAILLYLATPYSADNWPPFEVTRFMGLALRYGFAWIGIAAVIGSVGMSVLPRWATIALALCVSAHTVLTSAAGYGDLLVASSAGLVAFLLCRRLRDSPAEVRRGRPWLIAVGLVGTFLILGFATSLRSERRATAYGPVAAYLDSHAARSASLAFRYDDESESAQPVYPLYGPSLSRRLHFLLSSETRPLELIEAEGIRWVVVAGSARFGGPKTAPHLRAVAFDPERRWVLLEREESSGEGAGSRPRGAG